LHLACNALSTRASPHCNSQGLLYLIPWMAAVPLYLTGGVVVTAACQAHLGFWGALGVAIGASTATKAVSVYALHQSLGRVRRHATAGAGWRMP
jgi:hypothetical protein